MGVTIQPIVQSPHYDQRVQLWRKTIFKYNIIAREIVTCGVTTGRRGSSLGCLTGCRPPLPGRCIALGAGAGTATFAPRTEVVTPRSNPTIAHRVTARSRGEHLDAAPELCAAKVRKGVVADRTLVADRTREVIHSRVGGP
jgi:hypothetical protein